MLDAVWQASHAAAVHAGRAKCMHCAHFTSKFNSEMKDILRQTSNGTTSNGNAGSHNRNPKRVSDLT